MDGTTQNRPADAAVGGGEADTLPRLLVHELSKTFGRQRVLHDLNLRVVPGELHALVGQNGSGKSTLAKILTGVHAADAGGTIEVDGTSLGTTVRVPAMREVGLAVVHQSLGLIEDATVVENVRAGRHRASRLLRRIDWSYEREQVAEVFVKLGCDLELDARVDMLSAEDRATVAIARAFQDHRAGKGLVIFDESTRALTATSLDRFYEMVTTVRRAGASVLLICHRLEEVLRVSDRVTVLRDGRVTGEGVRTAELDESALVRLMIGRDLRRREAQLKSAPELAASAAPTVEVHRLSGDTLADLSFHVAPGEIVGFTGLTGSGFEKIPYLLAGAQRATAGELQLADARFDLGKGSASARALSQAGVAFVPEKRADEGLALDQSMVDNITLPRVTARGSRLWVGVGWQREEATRMIERLGIIPPRPEAILGTLSGGNQQKVLLAKWLAGEPKLLLLHEPTQAVDVSAREDIIDTIRDAAASGCAVIVAGSDPQELAALCDRVIVLRDGRIGAELTRPLDEDAIVSATFSQPTRA